MRGDTMYRVRHRETGEEFTLLSITEWTPEGISGLDIDGNAVVRDKSGEMRWIEGHRLEVIK